MIRREFITLLGGAAVWPLQARAQQPDRMRRIGVLQGGTPEPDAESDIAAFVKRLGNLGWSAGRNLFIDYRWAAGDVARMRVFAQELLSLAPDVVLATGSGPVAVLREETRTVPIVFARVSDPVGQGFVASLARPGGNVTGFSNFEFTLGSKWLQTLTEVAPNVTRVAVIADPGQSALDGFFHSIAAASGSLGVESVRTPVSNLEELEHAIATAGNKPGGGLIILPDGFLLSNRSAVIAQAMKYRLPAIYPFRFLATDGGLVSYGINTNEQYRAAAGYVDRILRGEKASDLPVQAPAKFELVINLKTAKALGIEVPPMLLARADKVIE
jgi:putative tryptophan/tyrosine transport system substrate-binding protein